MRMSLMLLNFMNESPPTAFFGLLLLRLGKIRLNMQVCESSQLTGIFQPGLNFSPHEELCQELLATTQIKGMAFSPRLYLDFCETTYCNWCLGVTFIALYVGSGCLYHQFSYLNKQACKACIYTSLRVLFFGISRDCSLQMMLFLTHLR